MNVLHVIPAIAPRYGGPSYALGVLAKALVENDVRVVIATTDADGAGRLPVPLDGLSEWQGIPIRYFPRQCSEAFKYSRPMARWLKRHVVDFDLVHIHAVFSHSSVAAYKACLEARVPYIVRPLGTLDPQTIRRKAMRKWLFAVAWGSSMLSQAAGIHYSTRREKELVENSLGLTGGFVVPIGVSVEANRATVETAYGCSPVSLGKSPYMIYVGRLHPIKNVELLIDAFDEATSNDEFRCWRLLIAGDGDVEYVANLRSHAARTDALDRIQFVGWLNGSSKVNALVAAELFVSFSGHENFGRSVVEAMSLGVPVLISDNVFIADEIRRADAGWVACGSLEKSIHLLREAISHRDERRMKGSRARRLVSEQLEMKRSAERMMTYYEAAVDAWRRLSCQPT